jgi:copper(I)-binding protein
MKAIYLVSVLMLCSFVCFYGEANTLENKHSSTIVVEDAYVRATIPGTSISSAYMTIINNSDTEATLLSAHSNISPRIEIHQHTMADGMMRMRKVDSIDIEAKERVKLQPSGLHLMVFDVKKPLKSQQLVELTLNFSNNEFVNIQIPVYSPTQEQAAQKSAPKMHKHHH